MIESTDSSGIFATGVKLDEMDIARFHRFVNKEGTIPEHCPEIGRCWHWMAALAVVGGYGQFKAKRKMHKAHRVAYILENGPIPDGMLICHKCDNTKCVNPSHLFAGTPLDNMRDMIQKGRGVPPELHWSRTHPEKLARGDRSWPRTHPEKLKRGDEHHSRKTPEVMPRGEKHWLAKMTAEKVRELRKKRSEGMSCKELGKLYGISDVSASQISRRYSWKHVE